MGILFHGFFLIVTLFLFGVCVGSFMEVVRDRRSWRRSLVGRSQCAHCSQVLSWKELIPLFSHLALRGKCRSCKAVIPKQHLFAEGATGLLFVLAGVVGDSVWSVSALLLPALFLVPIVNADRASMEVPEHLSLPFAYLAFFVALLHALAIGSSVPLVSGLVLSLPFVLFWLCSKGRAMGLGDAKVAISLGLLLADPTQAVSVLLFSFWIGTIIVAGIALRLKVQGKPVASLRRARMPFVPCIALAYLLVLLTDVTVFSVVTALL